MSCVCWILSRLYHHHHLHQEEVDGPSGVALAAEVMEVRAALPAVGLVLAGEDARNEIV